MRFAPVQLRLPQLDWPGWPAEYAQPRSSPLVNADFGQTPVIASSAAATLPVTLVMRTGVMTVDLLGVFLAANACSKY